MNLQASVIIPTFEDWAGLQTCLDCLAAQTAAAETFEIIVANNNPSPEVPATLLLPPNARVIHAEKPGSYAARNVAIKVAHGEVLFFTDSDCRPDPGWIAAGLAAIEPLAPFGRVAGAIELFPAGPDWTTIELFDRAFHMHQEVYCKNGWCATANLVVRKPAFDEVGLFDAGLFSGGDSEWGNRATALGHGIVYSAETLVRHPARSSFAEIAKKRRRVLGGLYLQRMTDASTQLPRPSLAERIAYAVNQAMLAPGLTDWQRIRVLAVSFRLGLVSFAEMLRLQYLSGKPKRA
jgi:glycosyltransferase involved in cell wall biosynthesis